MNMTGTALGSRYSNLFWCSNEPDTFGCGRFVSILQRNDWPIETALLKRVFHESYLSIEPSVRSILMNTTAACARVVSPFGSNVFAPVPVMI